VREMKLGESGEILDRKREIVSKIGDFGERIEDLGEKCEERVNDRGCRVIERESMEEK